MPMLENPRPSLSILMKNDRSNGERERERGGEGGGRRTWALVLCSYHCQLKPIASSDSTTSLSAKAMNWQ